MFFVRKTFPWIIFLFISIFVFLLSDTASAQLPDPLIGTWGYARLRHDNDGAWYSKVGKITFNSDNTGTDSYQYNDNGIVGSLTENFNYTITNRIVGTRSVAYTFTSGPRTGNTEVREYVISDNGNMMIMNGAVLEDRQKIKIFVRMDESWTYSDADVAGKAYGIGYGYDSAQTLWPGNFASWSTIQSFDGNGNAPGTITLNIDGGLFTESSQGSYSVNPDGSFVMNNDWLGYPGGPGLSVLSTPDIDSNWSIGFGMKRKDRTYSSADLAGTFAFIRFGDEDIGDRFNAEFGTSTCDKLGNCAFSAKVNTDGDVKYYNDGTAGHSITIRSDGSFGPSDIKYAAAMGNNGNTLIHNSESFEQNELWDRWVMVGVRCSYCWNLAGQKIPMLAFNLEGSDNGINLYLYDPISGLVDTVKENTYDSWYPSINPEQTKMVYTEGIESGCYTMYVYDFASKTATQITTATTKRAAYFNEDGKIIFIDCADSKIKRMDSDGSNIVALSLPFSQHDDVFWMSPDRDTIAVTKTRREGSYDTTNYQRIVLMDPDGNVKCSTPEYLGDWNNLSWKPDSSGFLFYRHKFQVVDGVFRKEIPKYELIKLNCSVVDLSNTDIGKHKNGQAKEENVCFFTKTGNLLSITYQELYNGQTGALIKDVSATVPDCSPAPCIPDAMYGLDPAFNGDIFFADSEGSNFRRFIESLQIIVPNGWEGIPSGSTYRIKWMTPPDAVKYDLQYSLDNGVTWIPIANKTGGTQEGAVVRTYDWTVPVFLGNKTCLLKVIGYNNSDVKVWTDKSDAPFTIEAVKLISPDGGEVLKSGQTWTIKWKTNGTKRPVAKVKLWYTKDGGANWIPIDTINGSNPGIKEWTPTVGAIKTSCKVRVDLIDERGNILADESNNYFMIQP